MRTTYILLTFEDDKSYGTLNSLLMFIYNLQSKKTEKSIGGLNRGVDRDKYLGVICNVQR